MLRSEIVKYIDNIYSVHKDEFKKCDTKLKRIDFFLEKDCTEIPFFLKTGKDEEKSQETRIAGNESFRLKQYFKALERYTKSIALGSSKDALFAAYSNRSALLTKVGLYPEALVDVNRALAIQVKPNLISRKEKLLKKKCQKKTPVILENINNLLVQNDKKYGNYVVAKNDLEIGDILLSESPLSCSLVTNECFYCHSCLTVCYNPIPCDACSVALYCDENCKNNDFHKYECKIGHFIEGFALKPSIFKLALKLTIQKLRDESNVVKRFEDMKTHFEDRSLMMIFEMSWFTAAFFDTLTKRTVLEFPEIDFKLTFLDALQVVGLYCLSINRLEPNDSRYNIVTFGCGLYYYGSLLNHSCFPNAFFYHDGSQIIIRALTAIKKGEQCFISYGPTFPNYTTVERQKLLSQSYFFHCACPACCEDWLEESQIDVDFDTPNYCVQMAISHLDNEVLQSFIPKFTSRLKMLPNLDHSRIATSLRQLVVDCYHIYSDPKMIKQSANQWV